MRSHVRGCTPPYRPRAARLPSCLPQNEQGVHEFLPQFEIEPATTKAAKVKGTSRRESSVFYVDE